jgi:hypothetical protein
MKYKMTYPQECWVDSYFIKTQYSDAVANGEIDWEHLAIDEDDLESIIQALKKKMAAGSDVPNRVNRP